MALTDLVKRVEPSKRPVAANIVTELNFMRQQLVKLRKEIRENGCTELFVQGKQSMTRLTPAFQGYTTLITRFNQLNKQLVALIPDGFEEDDELDEFLKELA